MALAPLAPGALFPAGAQLMTTNASGQIVPAMMGDTLMMVNGRIDVIQPIAPTAVKSANLTEYFMIDAATSFSNSAGTTAATTGNPCQYIKAQAGRSETLTQTGASSQPTFVLDSVTGRYALYSANVPANGNSAQCMNRSYTGHVGTAFVAYTASPQSYVATGACTLLSQPTSFNLRSLHRPSGNPSVLSYEQIRSDTTSAWSVANPHFGDPDILMVRSDGTNTSMSRYGKQCLSSVATVPTTTTWVNPTGTYSVLGARVAINSSGVATALTDYFNGNIFALITFDGPLSDWEAAGVSAWLKAQINPPIYKGRYLGAYFYGDGSNESATAEALALVQSDDLITWTHRPCSGVPRNTFQPTGGDVARDFGLCGDGSAVFLTQTTYPLGGSDTNPEFDIHVCRDTFNFVMLSTVSVLGAVASTGSTQVWAPSFVRNEDGTMWKDTNNLPAIMFCCAPDNTNTDFKIGLVQPVDQTWEYGGPWQAAVLLTGTFTADAIDPACNVTSDGTFHLVYASQSNGSVIGHSTSSALRGPYTVQGSADAFDLGTLAESPQQIKRYDGTWVTHIDKHGDGYQYATSSTGIAGTYSTPAPITCPFIPQHGEFTLLPFGW